MSALIQVTKPILLWMDKEKHVRVCNVGTQVVYLSTSGSVSEWDVPLNPGFGVEWYGEVWGYAPSGTNVTVSQFHGDIFQLGDSI